jgi:hypothetical protein
MKTKTLVLGAGASAAYRFPSGPGLIEKIPDLLLPVERPESKFAYQVFERERILWFSEQIRKTPIRSIDRFLANHHADKPLLELGKYCIGWHILKAEENHKGTPIHDWCQYFFNKLLELSQYQPESIEDVPINIITFNYDRCLEYVIVEGLVRSFPITLEKAVEIGKKYAEKRITHVHGSLGDLDSLPYGTMKDYSIILESFKANIKVVHEGQDGRINFRVKSALSDSKEVYFIGFGYLEDNLEKLIFNSENFQQINHAINVAGSCYDLKPAEISDITTYFMERKKLNIDFHTGNMDIPNMKALDYIRSVIRFRA